MGEEFRETLYTIDSTGRRKWVYPTLVEGLWFRRRQIVAYLLIAFYLSMPWITIKGKQGIFLDFSERKFHFFGETFWATDTLFVVIVLATLAFSLFFFTALFGRIWCGWACPETVFLEFVFRPIERLIEGGPVQRRRLDEMPWSSPEKIRKKLLKHAFCAAMAWILASTALAYFIGREPLLNMMLESPRHHPVPFAMTLVLMGLMAFQFGWFREQFCTVLCPYARFQGVMMDANSLVVGYDTVRGEPRGKRKKNIDQTELGDCIDCGACVRVCPTGIDIRNGLQLECINCTQCIDACDEIMEKVGKPKGLIRYDTENRLVGDQQRIIRPRILIYASIIAFLSLSFIYALRTRELSEFQILRSRTHSPFEELADGKISNHLMVKVSNKQDILTTYRFEKTLPSGVELITPLEEFTIEAGQIRSIPVFAQFSKSLLDEEGKLEVQITLSDQSGYRETQSFTVLGPGK